MCGRCRQNDTGKQTTRDGTRCPQRLRDCCEASAQRRKALTYSLPVHPQNSHRTLPGMQSTQCCAIRRPLSGSDLPSSTPIRWFRPGRTVAGRNNNSNVTLLAVSPSFKSWPPNQLRPKQNRGRTADSDPKLAAPGHHLLSPVPQSRTFHHFSTDFAAT